MWRELKTHTHTNTVKQVWRGEKKKNYTKSFSPSGLAKTIITRDSLKIEPIKDLGTQLQHSGHPNALHFQTTSSRFRFFILLLLWLTTPDAVFQRGSRKEALYLTILSMLLTRCGREAVMNDRRREECTRLLREREKSAVSPLNQHEKGMEWKGREGWGKEDGTLVCSTQRMRISIGLKNPGQRRREDQIHAPLWSWGRGRVQTP